MEEIYRVGIDTGISGAVAILAPDRTWDIFSMPTKGTGEEEEVDGAVLADKLWFLRDKPHRVSVEDPRGAEQRLKKKQRGTAVYFTRFGIVWGVVMALSLFWRLVRPISWQTAAEKKELKDKMESIQKALEFYPETKKLLLNDGSQTTYSDGKAEAVLMVHWDIVTEAKGQKKRKTR